MNRQEKLAYEQGVDVRLLMALTILEDLADVMLERERAAPVGRKANYARRTRIKAYQVAGKRVQTRLDRQRRVLAKLETFEDQLRGENTLKAALKDLAL